MDYYTDIFVNKLKRDPTDVELFDIGQSNSEHSRHWYFGGTIVVDGKPAHALAEEIEVRARARFLREQPNFEEAARSKDHEEAMRDEMRKVAWPTKPEVIRYSTIVTVTVVIYTAIVAGLDFGLREIMDWFYT